MFWFSAAVKKYAVFSGRARRKEFWYFTLFELLGFFIPILVAVVIAVALGPEPGGMRPSYGEVPRSPAADFIPPLFIVSGVWFLFCLVPGISVSVRRLHDIGKSGWWLFIGCIPFGIGTVIQLVLFAQEGDKGANGYGEDPKGETGSASFYNDMVKADNLAMARDSYLRRDAGALAKEKRLLNAGELVSFVDEKDVDGVSWTLVVTVYTAEKGWVLTEDIESAPAEAPSDTE